MFAKPARRKYRNTPCEYNGRVYPSKAQAHHAQCLDAQVRAGLIKGWLPEVSLPLPGNPGRRMRIDALVVDANGRLRLQDVKGMAPTKDWQLKREQIERALGIPIDIVSRTRGR